MHSPSRSFAGAQEDDKATMLWPDRPTSRAQQPEGEEGRFAAAHGVVDHRLIVDRLTWTPGEPGPVALLPLAAGHGQVELFRWMLVAHVVHLRRHQSEAEPNVIPYFKTSWSDQHRVGVTLVKCSTSRQAA